MDELEQEHAEVSMDVIAFEPASNRVFNYNPDHELARALEFQVAAAGDREEEIRTELAERSGGSRALG